MDFVNNKIALCRPTQNWIFVVVTKCLLDKRRPIVLYISCLCYMYILLCLYFPNLGG